ncbi:hypothetical protein D041_1839A, partial [Vibrio parahaemolyticus EKP-008]
MDSIWALQFLP